MNNEFKNRVIEKIKRELGSEILNFLSDNSVIEIILNSDKTLWVEKLGEDMKFVSSFSDSKAKSIISSIASYMDTVVDSNNPILECELPLDGSRFEALLPPVVSSPVFSIRKKAIKVFTLNDYENSKILTKNQKEIIIDSIKNRKNILIVGGTGSGKTTFANAIIAAISEYAPEQRIIIIEDTAELQCSSKNKTILKTSDKVDMLKLLKATMRLRPDRIIVGETRGKEALDLLKAWNTGHPGGLATVHANSAYAGLTRIEQLISEISVANMSRLIAEAINLVVFIKKTKYGRIIDEIIEVVDFDNINNKYVIKNL